MRGRARRAWRALDRSPRARWVKKMIAFPIGERFAAISLSAAFFDARVTFIVLLAWGGLSTAYNTAGRVLRSRRWPIAPGRALALSRDDGPLASRVRLPWPARLRWAGPPLVRLAEYGALIGLALAAGARAMPAAFALLAALAYRHYDLTYRLRHRGATPARWVNVLSLGWDGRVIGAAILLALGILTAGYWVAATIFAAAFVGESVAGWLAGAPRAAGFDDEEDEGL
jgi:Family of unknown function (DUF5941)